MQLLEAEIKDLLRRNDDEDLRDRVLEFIAYKLAKEGYDSLWKNPNE
jgi:hypothetical protein